MISLQFSLLESDIRFCSWSYLCGNPLHFSILHFIIDNFWYFFISIIIDILLALLNKLWFNDIFRICNHSTRWFSDLEMATTKIFISYLKSKHQYFIYSYLHVLLKLEFSTWYFSFINQLDKFIYIIITPFFIRYAKWQQWLSWR